VAGVFPGRDAIIRLVGAVPAEHKHEWAKATATWDRKSLPPAANPITSKETSETARQLRLLAHQ
jgi:hypothetical protein